MPRSNSPYAFDDMIAVYEGYTRSQSRGLSTPYRDVSVVQIKLPFLTFDRDGENKNCVNSVFFATKQIIQKGVKYSYFNKKNIIKRDCNRVMGDFIGDITKYICPGQTPHTRLTM